MTLVQPFPTPNKSVRVIVVKIMKILIRLFFALVGAIIGLLLGGAASYIISLLITPEGQETTLIFIIIFALVTSQIGLILGPYIAIPILNNTRWRLPDSQPKGQPNPRTSGPVA